MSKQVWARVLGGAGVGLMLLLGGCGGGFFTDPNTTTTTTTSSGDYVYVANQTTNTLSGFVVGSSTLTAVSGSPYALLSGLAGASVAVNRPNTYVYVGGSGAIECFSIGTSGVLTLVNSSAATAAANFVSLDTSPDGKWLIALDSTTLTLYVYGINTSTGALSLTATLIYSAPGAGTAVPRSVRISPNGLYIIATLAAGGDTIFTFTTSTGVPVQAATLAVASGVSDNAVTFDSSTAYAYFARGGSTAGTSGVASYAVGTGGALTAVQTLAVAGSTPYSVLLDSAGSYVYTANRGDGTVSGFSVASGTLTALSGSPYSSGLFTQALVEDNSKKYVIAASFGGSSDLTMYSFDAITLGKLDPVAVIASGTDPAGVVGLAATH